MGDNTLFDDLFQGLNEAIDFEKHNKKAKISKYQVTPIKEYTGKQIRDIRMKADMTQKVLALYMGVSVKTVEAWECERTHPTGPALRLLNFLESNEDFIIDKIIVKS